MGEERRLGFKIEEILDPEAREELMALKTAIGKREIVEPMLVILRKIAAERAKDAAALAILEILGDEHRPWALPTRYRHSRQHNPECQTKNRPPTMVLGRKDGMSRP